MNKTLLLCSLALLCGAVSCTSRKDRLVADTLVISVASSAATVAPGSALTLQASAKSARSNNVDINPSWSVNPAAAGTFSPASGKNTTFTAGSAASGAATIYATYESVRGQASITVGSGGSGGGTVPDNVFLADAGTSSLAKITGGFLLNYFDTNNLPPWDIATSDAFSGCTVDPLKCTKIDYFNHPGGNGGFYIEYTTPQDLSAYSKLTFYVKGAVGGENVKVGMKSTTDFEAVKLDIGMRCGGITTAWKKVEIPFATFITAANSNGRVFAVSSVEQPFIIACENAWTGSDATLYIDYVRFE